MTVPELEIIVPDSGPLITLAVADALDTLLLPKLPVIVPDMVRHEVVRDPSKPGSTEVADWLRKNEPASVRVASTEEYEEYCTLLAMKPESKLRNRGERAAGEVLNKELARGVSGAILIYEDSAVRRGNFLDRLPDNVLILSTSSFLDGLQKAGLISNAEAILEAAVKIRPKWIRERDVRITGAPKDSIDWSSQFGPK